LKKLKIYLRTTAGLSERSVMNVFVMIRLLYNKAINRKIVDRKFYPFGKDKLKIKYPQTIKIGLDETEIRKIEELDLDPRTSVWHTRNVFLFSFYLAGIRISDVLRMRWSDIVAERLYYKMSKNDKADSLKLPAPVITILSYYREDKRTKSDYIFPELKNIPLKDSFCRSRPIKRPFYGTAFSTSNYLKDKLSHSSYIKHICVLSAIFGI